MLGFLHFAFAQVGVTRCSLIADGPTAPVTAGLPWLPAPHFIVAVFVSRPLGDYAWVHGVTLVGLTITPVS